MASMKWLFKSSTNDDTLIISRHKSVIMDSTVKFAPNIRPPVFSFGFLRSIVASWRDQSSIRAPGLMKIDSHSSDWRRSSHYEGTSSCERRAPIASARASAKRVGAKRRPRHSFADSQSFNIQNSFTWRKRPAAQSLHRHTGPSNVTSQPSFDATSAKL